MEEAKNQEENVEIISGHTLARSNEVLPTLIHLLPVSARPFFPGQAVPLLMEQAHWESTLEAVTEARSKVASMQVSSDIINDPQKMKQFQAAQANLTGALSRLMVVVERYPDLKANQNFLALQSQLEGTENRISVARRDYIAAVQKYNTELRTYPGKLWYKMLYSDMKLHATYEATAQEPEKAPTVKF